MSVVRRNKYNAKKTKGVNAEGQDHWYPSKLEAGVAAELYMEMQAGEIEYFDTQHSIRIVPCDTTGAPIEQCAIVHKVDFRAHLGKDEYRLVEAKGFETREYARIAKLIDYIFIPANPNYTYEVRKNSVGNRRRGARSRYAQRALSRGLQ